MKTHDSLKTTIIVLSFTIFSQCVNNKRSEKYLLDFYNENVVVLSQLVDVINSKYIEVDSRVFYDCKPGSYLGNKYSCDSLINDFLGKLKAKSITLGKEVCDSVDFVRTFQIDVGLRGYERNLYLNYSSCRQEKSDYENSRFKVIPLNAHWSIFEEKD